MFVPQFTLEEVVAYITLPYEKTVARKHTVRCLERAAQSAAENGAEGTAEEFTWAATYLDGGDADCTCTPDTP